MARLSDRISTRKNRPLSVKPLLEILEDRYVLDAWGLNLDFGSSSSPVASGYQRVEVQPYDARTGYGWTDISGISAVERETTSTAVQNRAFQTGQRGTFVVDVPNGEYQVTLRLGDPAGSSSDVVGGLENQVFFTSPSTSLGQIKEQTFKVRVTDNQLSLMLSARGENTSFALNSIKLYAKNVQKPSSISLTGSAILENGAVGTLIGSLSTKETNLGKGFRIVGGGTYTYTLVSGAGSTDNGMFAIVGNQLVSNSTLDFEAKATRSVRIRTTAAGGLSFEKVFTINVQNVNESPTALSLSTNSIQYSRPAGTLVGLLSTTDSDVGDKYTYSLVSGEGSADNASFAVQGNSLKTNSVLGTGSYSIRVRSTDKGGLFTEQAMVITTYNSTPTDIALAGTSIQENKSVGSVVSTLSTSDRDTGEAYTYTLVDGTGSTDNALFSISGNQLITNSVLNYEEQTTRTIRIRSTDLGGMSVEKVFKINVQNSNEAPTLFSLSNNVILLSSTGGKVVGEFSTSDPDQSDSFTYKLVSGAGSTNNTSFALQGSTLKTSKALPAGSYSIRVRSTDKGGLFTEQAIVITVYDPPQAPTNISLAGSSILENKAVGTLVGTLSTTDPNASDTFTYALVSGTGSTDNDLFSISGNQLITNSPLDYETLTSRSVRIKVNDADSLSFEKVFTINVQNSNEAPTSFSLSNTAIQQSASTGTLVGVLSTTDPDQGDTFTYSLVTGTGSTNNSSFVIQGNSLKTKAILTAGSHSIRVRSTDAGGLSTEQVIALTVTNSNLGPTDLSLSGSSILENKAAGTLVGTLSTTDPNAGDTFTYALVSGTGSTDNGLFSISGNQLITNSPLDYETLASRTVRIKTTDAGGMSFEKVFTLSIQNSNEAPTSFLLSSTAIQQNASIGTLVGVLSTTDPDQGDTFTYSLVTGTGSTNNSSFVIQGNSLKTNTTLAAGAYTIRIRSTDAAGLFTEQSIALTVTNSNLGPTNISLLGSSILENKAAGTLVGIMSTTDPNSNDTFTYALVSGTGSTDNGLFSISGNQLITNSPLDYETLASRTVRIKTTDAGGMSFEKVFTLSVQNSNEAPTSFSLSSTAIQQNASIGTLVGVLSTTDPDQGDTFTYSLVSGTGSTNNSSFVIQGNSLKTNATLAAGAYTIRIRSTDAAGLFTEQSIALTVTNSNQAPTNISLSGSSILENKAAGTLVGIMSTIDPNAGDTATYALVTGTGSTDNSLFSISGNQLITNGPLNFESQTSRSVRIKTTDAGGLSFEKIFTLGVQNVNETPISFNLSNNVISQSVAAGTVVGTLTTNDPDQGDSFTYSLVSGTGSTNNANFVIQGNSLKTNATLSAGSYSIRVRSTDTGGLFAEQVINISSNDNSPPTVALTSPASNTTVKGSINLLVNVSDNVGVISVQYYLNGQPLGPVLNSGNYSYTWNTTQVSNGTHILTAKASDAVGNMTTSAMVTVTVNNPVDNNPINKPVLNQGDFTYLGAFNLPVSANGKSTSFSTGGLTHRYVNGNLQFLSTNHVYTGGLVYEFNYPGLNTNGSMPTATVVNNWGDVYTGNKWSANGTSGGTSLGSGVATYGLYFDQNLNRLYWNYGHWYNVSYPYNPSLGYSTLNDTTGVATGVGAWSLENRPEKFSRGGTLRIPQWFADSYTDGNSLGVGFGGYFSIISTGSLGPSLAAVADPDITINPNRSALSNVPLVGYPMSASTRAQRTTNYTSFYDSGVYPTQPGNWNPSNGTGYWTWSDTIFGSASWIDTPSLGGVLYLARLGTGDVYYKDSTTHGSGSEFAWMVYDPKDLAAVASGAKQQWQIQPKYSWVDNTLPVGPQDLAGFAGEGTSLVGGVTFDATTNRLYVLVNASYKSGVEWYPRMYVYQVGPGAPSSVVLPSENHFQFGVTSAPTVSGYQKVTKDQYYNPNIGYGWLIGANWSINNGNTSQFANQGTATKEGTFAARLANGTYQVTIRLGDPTLALDNMGIYLQDQLMDNLNSSAGQSLTKTYTVSVVDGLLRLRLRDLGGISSEVAIQSLDILKI